MKLSFVTTIYRTADQVETFARRAEAAAGELGLDYEVVFVNDGSPDDGLSVALGLAERNRRVVVVDLSRNFGQHKALWTGIQTASGSLIAVMDGDMEEDPMWMVRFRQTLTAEHADVVYGVQERPKGNTIYRACRRAFYRVLDIVSDLKFPRDVTTARLMTRRYVDALLSFDEREIFLVGIMHVAGFKQVGVPVKKENLSPTKYSLPRLIQLFTMAVTAFSVTPLIAVFVAGLALSGLACLYIVYLLAAYFLRGFGVPGWTSVMAALMLFSGVLTMFSGLIAIYVGTIFLEVKRRPRTIVRSVTRSDERGTADSLPASHDELLHRVASYYAQRLGEHGPTARGVDWRDERTQEIRFAQLAKVFRGASIGSVAEIGCGYGALASWLRRQGSSLDYVGYDIALEMIAAADATNGQLTSVRFQVGSEPEPADFVIASGIFNVSLETPDAVWRDYVEAVLITMKQKARVGFAFNCLTSFSDPDRRAAHLWYADPGELLDWCMAKFGRHVALYHDYELYEFTIAVWVEPEKAA